MSYSPFGRGQIQLLGYVGKSRLRKADALAVIFEAVPDESVAPEKSESGTTQWLVQSDKEGLAYPVDISVGIPWIGIHSIGSKRTKAHTQGSSRHVAVCAKPSYETGSSLHGGEVSLLKTKTKGRAT